MDRPDDEIIFERGEELTERANEFGVRKDVNAYKTTHLRRDKMRHLLHTAQANSARKDNKAAKRPKPSLPKLPWDSK